jgi:N-acetylmuramoyl-L-alanine amidase
MMDWQSDEEEEPMQPYVICQGDYLAKLAYKFDFDADAVWNDPSNDDLRKLRPNPNIFLAGDILYIPDQVDKQPVVHTLVTGTTNSFVSPEPPTTTVTHKFVGDDSNTYASKAYTVKELDQLTGLTSDGDGVVTFQIPVTLDTVTVVFTDTGESWPLSVGDLDPINSRSGIFQRLQHLAYIDADVDYHATDPSELLGMMRSALLLLKADNGDDPPASDAGPSAPASSSNDSTDLTGGLSDDGTLDDETTSLLVTVYGS